MRKSEQNISLENQGYNNTIKIIFTSFFKQIDSLLEILIKRNSNFLFIQCYIHQYLIIKLIDLNSKIYKLNLSHYQTSYLDAGKFKDLYNNKI